jgi:SAM-dependent methyltransferase
MAPKYDPYHISQFYDTYSEREWGRFDLTPARRVNLHLHSWYLQQYIKAGDHVLDVGAGPGRFSIEMAKLGARITVGDISPGQLELHREKVAEAGYEEAIVAREIVDIVDLSKFASDSFDAVVCYGGPLSYVFERADDAMKELLRVTKPGGYVLLSVMSLIGTTHAFLPGVVALAKRHGLERIQQVNDTGDLYGDVATDGHNCHMYRWSELQALLQRHPCTLVAASASNFLSIRNDETLQEVMNDDQMWETFLRWEIDFCKEPGAIDGGTHIIAVVQSNPRQE